MGFNSGFKGLIYLYLICMSDRSAHEARRIWTTEGLCNAPKPRVQGWRNLGINLTCFLQCYSHLPVRDVSVATAALFMRMSTPPRLSLTHLKAASTSDSLLMSHFTAYSLPDADSRDMDSSCNKVNKVEFCYWHTRWMCLLVFYLFVQWLTDILNWR